MTQILVPRRSLATVPPVVWRDFDRLFDQLWRGFSAPVRSGVAAVTPRIDVAETAAELRVDAEMPGLDEKDIEVSIENEVLTIAGDRGAPEQSATEAGLRHRETFRGKFRRALRLPDAVDVENVSAVYRNGILTVTLPKTPAAGVRNIPITGTA